MERARLPPLRRSAPALVEAVQADGRRAVDVMSVCSIYDAALSLLSMRVWDGRDGRAVAAQNRVRVHGGTGRRVEYGGHQIRARRDERERARTLGNCANGLRGEGREGNRRVGRGGQRAFNAAKRIGRESRAAGRAGCACRPRRASRALRPCQALCALNALRTCRARCALRPGYADGTPPTLRSLCALRPLRPCGPVGP